VPLPELPDQGERNDAAEREALLKVHERPPPGSAAAGLGGRAARARQQLAGARHRRQTVERLGLGFAPRRATG
jgi:hypothetical protein